MDISRVNSRMSTGRTIFGDEAKTMANMLREHIDNDKAQKDSEVKTKTHKKGTMAGVFIPTCEGMWGVLIFLKFSYIVGIGGVFHALVAVFVSFIAALCTTTCVSAIASSGGVVSEGGPYHMVSRAFGPYVGVSVGITYWIGITFLGVMEAIGAVEALEIMAGSIFSFTWAMQVLGSCVMAILTLFVFGGINLVTRLGVVFGAVVLITIILYFVSLGLAPLDSHNPSQYLTGLSWTTLQNNWWTMYPSGKDFGTLMSLFFPCFTGILAGADRSDILRDPPRNIMYGTFAAIIFSLFMYATFMVLWGAVAEGCYLRGDCATSATSAVASLGNVLVRRLSGSDTAVADEAIATQLLWPSEYVVLSGVIISCCSQVLQCLITAPRILNQIAKDHLITWMKPLSVLSKRGEPARALLATYVLSAGLVLIGSVDILAPMVTISFLVCYGFLNLACLLLTALRTPTWRPTGIFQLRYRIFYMVSSSIGFLACLAIALVVSKFWTLGVVFFALFLYWYVARAGEEVEWGSGMDGLRYGLALSALTGLKREQHRRINWRPQILAMYPLGNVNTPSLHGSHTKKEGLDHGASNVTVESASRRGSPKRRHVHGSGERGDQLLKFCAQLRKGRGMCVVAGILEGCGEERTPLVTSRIREERVWIDSMMESNGISGFSEVVAANSWMEGAKFVCQLAGLGGLRPNTLIVPWPTDWRTNTTQAVDYLRLIQMALAEDKAVVSPKNLCALPLGEECVEQTGHIDLWWFITDGGLLVLITWLLAQHRVWRQCTVRVFVVVENVSAEMAEEAAEAVRAIFKLKRILTKVTVEAVVLSDEMIEPYTYDLTLKVDSRRVKRGIHHTPSSSNLPHTLDDLFSQPQATEPASSSSEPTPVEQSGLRKLISRAIRPRRKKVSATPPKETTPKSVVDAFQRRETVSVDNEKDLLAGVGERCRQRRRVLDSALEDMGEDIDDSEWEGESTVGELMGAPPVQQSTASVFEKLNQVILSRSNDSSLVLLNLPDIWGTSTDDCISYMAFCECLIKGLEKVVFVHSSGSEVVRIF